MTLQETYFTIGRDLETLAQAARASVREDIDDLGPLRYFRFSVPAAPSVEIELYAHDHQPVPGVHVLSSAPDDLDAIAAALRQLGVAPDAVLSATDGEGANVADLDGIRRRLTTVRLTLPERLHALAHAMFHRERS